MTSINYTSPIACAVLFVVLLVGPAEARAFTFSDGTQQACWANDEVVGERYHPPGDPTAPGGFIGFTHFDAGTGWTIDWNVLMLSSVPGYAHDFAFFHECAHAKLRSFDELQANCHALLDMRAAGRSGRDVEAKLATYHRRLGDMGPQYGQGKEFWAKTVACANAAAAATQSSANR